MNPLLYTYKGLAPVVVLPGLFLKGVAEVCVHVCKALHKDRVQIHIGIIRLKFQNCEKTTILVHSCSNKCLQNNIHSKSLASATLQTEGLYFLSYI